MPPLPEGTRYRWKTMPSGKKVRLAFLKGTAIEVKPKGGAAHLIRRSLHGSGSFRPDDLLRGYRRVG